MARRRFRPNKTQRLLDLIAYLSGRRRGATVDAVMTEVPGYARSSDSAANPDSLRRRFERDKADLRDLGVPLESVETLVRGEVEVRYRLRPDAFYMPVVRLLASGAAEDDPVSEPGPAGSDRPARPPDRAPPGSASRELAVRPEELRIAVEALLHVQKLPAFPFRREARSALAKITFDLAPEMVSDDPAHVRHLPPFDPVEVGQVLDTVGDALRRRKTLRFDYYAISRDRTEEREVHALGLFYQGSRWYLVAHDLAREGVRVFRIERIGSVEVAGGRTPDYEIDEDHRLADYRDRNAWDLGEWEEETEVVVRFAQPLSLLAERNAWGEPVGTDGAVRRFAVRSTEPLLRWLLTHSPRVEILEPRELGERLAELRRRLLEVHS